MRHLSCLILSFICVAMAMPGRAAPSDSMEAMGLWDRDDGLGGVKIAPCGDALCGDVVWLKHPEGPAHIGERLVFDMHKTAADTWTGSALNPEDGGTYAGSMIVAGDRLTMKGCAAFGLLCRSVGLSRAKTKTAGLSTDR